jgi:hypothetical protein
MVVAVDEAFACGTEASIASCRAARRHPEVPPPPSDCRSAPTGQGLTSAPFKELMERLTRSTGGLASFTERIDELHGIFAELLEELSQQYGLGYQPTNRARQQLPSDQGRRRGSAPDSRPAGISLGFVAESPPVNEGSVVQARNRIRCSSAPCRGSLCRFSIRGEK